MSRTLPSPDRQEPHRHVGVGGLAQDSTGGGAVGAQHADHPVVHDRPPGWPNELRQHQRQCQHREHRHHRCGQSAQVDHQELATDPPDQFFDLVVFAQSFHRPAARAGVAGHRRGDPPHLRPRREAVDTARLAALRAWRRCGPTHRSSRIIRITRSQTLRSRHPREHDPQRSSPDAPCCRADQTRLNPRASAIAFSSSSWSTVRTISRGMACIGRIFPCCASPTAAWTSPADRQVTGRDVQVRVARLLR
jgi:hypothetical protein